MDIAIVVGTRPEIVKMAPIILALDGAGLQYSLIHTGQHYDREMSEVFLEELGLRVPDTFMDIRSGTHAEQTAEALVELESAFLTIEPSVVLVEGDTNTVLGAALAAAKIGIDVGHVEAGLRSYDLRMPEEHNRRLTDHLSKYLFAPTEECERNLQSESVWGDVFVTGNTVIDACLRYLPEAEKRSDILERIDYGEYILATAHRAENVDDEATLVEFVKIFTSSPLPVVYPIHPRTKRRLQDFGVYEDLARSDNVQLLSPLGYFDFLVLLSQAKLILTDSGGIQEEATAPNLRKKVLVLRECTERPEAVEAGYAEVVGTKSERVLDRIWKWLEEPDVPTAPCPFGDGASGLRILDIVKAILEGHTPQTPLKVIAK